MSWLVYALLAPLIFTIVNFIDKLILEKHVRNPASMSPYIAIMALFNGSLLWIITGFPFPPLRDVFVVMVSGMLTSIGALLYYRALSMEETSKVIVLIQIQPVIVLTLSFLLLHETISAFQFIGFVLILGSAVTLAAKRGMGGIHFSKSLGLLLIVNFQWALSVVLFKLVTADGHFEQFLAYESWGFALGGLVIYLLVRSVRDAFHENFRTIPRQALGIIVVNETIFLGAKLLTLAAVALGPTALVSVLGGTQVFFGIVAGWALTVLAPTIYREEIARHDLIRKGAVALVLFIGITFINISL